MDENSIENSFSTYFYRRFPPVNPEIFIRSAKISQSLLLDTEKVINTIASSKTFAQNLMAAAQESNLSAVKNMILSTGTKTTPDISYTPDGIKLDFHPSVNPAGPVLSHIIIQLRWTDF